jgi:hypothetical protein
MHEYSKARIVVLLPHFCHLTHFRLDKTVCKTFSVFIASQAWLECFSIKMYFSISWLPLATLCPGIMLAVCKVANITQIKIMRIEGFSHCDSLSQLFVIILMTRLYVSLLY